MRACGFRRARTLFLTVFSFAFCFILLTNMMVNQLTCNVSNDSTDSKRITYSENQKKLRQLMEPDEQKLDSYIVSGGLLWAERKPKAANEKTLNYDIYQNVNITGPKDFDAVKRLQPFTKTDRNISEQNGIRNNHKTTRVKVDRYEENYVYEEDINKVVIQDDDDDDDDDYDVEKDNNKNIHDLKTKDFKNVSKHKNSKSEDKYDQEETNRIESQDLVSSTNSSQTQITDLVEDGIYWSPEAERLVPKGMSLDKVLSWIEVVRHEKIQMLQVPSWDRCGRPKNGFLVMKNGIELCARNRHPHDKLVLGEVMSFYLSLLLKMDNVPAVLLAQVNKTSPRWEGTDPEKLGWEDMQYIALIQWVDNIQESHSHVIMPPIVLDVYNKSNTLVGHMLTQHKLKPTNISSIIQWGTMIIFDYLTGNYDRVASMQDAAERQILPSIIEDDIRNLRKTTDSGKFWIIDNECGLLDAYELTYRAIVSGKRFAKFHQQMLHTICVFQRSLVDALRDLHNSINPAVVLEEYVRKHEPYFESVPRDNTYSLFQKHFPERLSEVIEWIQHCEEQTKR